MQSHRKLGAEGRGSASIAPTSARERQQSVASGRLPFFYYLVCLFVTLFGLLVRKCGVREREREGEEEEMRERETVPIHTCIFMK